MHDVDASTLTSFNVGVQWVHLSKWAWTVGYACIYVLLIKL